MTTQLDLFGEAKVKVEEPEPMTALRVGNRTIQIPLRRKRREALTKLMGILAELEDNLKLPKLKLDFHPIRFRTDHNYIPSVIVLWGSRSAQVRIFTNYLVAVREQEYQGYWHYLLDFRNGLWEHPIDTYYSHYACLTITRFKD